MPAILFGSISTLADTSELQRGAFNRAFEANGLDWHWDRDAYLSMLETSGGADRIAEYAASVGQDVDAPALHRAKSEIFQQSLSESDVVARPGVVESVRAAKEHGVKIALVTTTSRDNITALMGALGPDISTSDFDSIVDATNVEQPKPDSASYSFALESLGEKPSDCVAIEDNVDGVASATGAGLTCIAFPNENTAAHDFAQAERVVDRVDFPALQTSFLTA